MYEDLGKLMLLIYTQYGIYTLFTVDHYVLFALESNSTSQGLPYEYASTMHFRHNEFSRTKTKSTIIPTVAQVPKETLGSALEITYLDFLHINLLYCGGT